MAVKRSKSRGRDLKHTETQAGINVSRKVSGERGRTDGREAIGAISAASPKIQRRKPSLKRTPNLTREDIAAMPTARPHYPNELHMTKTGAVKLARYFVDPESLR